MLLIHKDSSLALNLDSKYSIPCKKINTMYIRRVPIFPNQLDYISDLPERSTLIKSLKLWCLPNANNLSALTSANLITLAT